MGERTLISFDYAVKYLLRSKTASDLAILGGFLTELMNRRVEVVDILESNKAIAEDEVNCVDLKARIDGGEFAVFEVQFLHIYDFYDKVRFGVSRAIVEQMTSGAFYGIKKVHLITIAYYNLTAKREYLFHGKYSGFSGVHFEDESIPFAQVVYHGTKENVAIHPEYYLILPGMFDDKLRGKFDEWVYILKHTSARDDFTADGIEEAKVKLDLLKMSPDAKKKYERYLDNCGSLDCAIITAKVDGEMIGIEKGIAQGKAQGIAEGIAQGKAEGIAQGIAETKKNIVLNMHKKGFNTTEIADATELTENEVENILKTERKL